MRCCGKCKGKRLQYNKKITIATIKWKPAHSNVHTHTHWNQVNGLNETCVHFISIQFNSSEISNAYAYFFVYSSQNDSFSLCLQIIPMKWCVRSHCALYIFEYHRIIYTHQFAMQTETRSKTSTKKTENPLTAHWAIISKHRRRTHALAQNLLTIVTRWWFCVSFYRMFFHICFEWKWKRFFSPSKWKRMALRAHTLAIDEW